ncbi:hypothetical protein ACFYTG_52990 [Streptomyces mirabilis]|uniref:hypothetical protein n=1 Tax=Streptomyces mirabilis TaxID=68239 RepID=UPI00369D2F7C
MTATAPSVLLTSVTNWTITVAWILGSFRMNFLITSTSLLVLRLSTTQEAGAKCTALQISNALPYVVLLAAPGTAFPPRQRQHDEDGQLRFPSGSLRPRVPADGRRRPHRGLSDDPAP